MTTLKDEFHALVTPFISDVKKVKKLWRELELAYNEQDRHYHNLTHLENIFIELNTVREQIEDWETVSFSVFYHDAVYNVRKKDNEERSADMAAHVLEKMGYPSDKIARCKAQIIGTKSHDKLADNDANLLTDADLSILGKDWKTYSTYVKQIRAEYKIFPTILYKPGRKKVLKHFLEMPQIYKTDYFRKKYEFQARENLKKELE